MIAAMSSSEAWQWALAIFLLLTAIGLIIVLLRASGTLDRVNVLLDGVTPEIVPMLGKVSTSIDHVNDELEKVGTITDSAVDATEKVDHSVRAVSEAISKPAKAAAGVSAGIKQGLGSLKTKRDERGGVV
jgi:uncharacterized protein YoxC